MIHSLIDCQAFSCAASASSRACSRRVSLSSRGKECLSYFWVVSWLISENEAEQRFLCGRVSGRVMRKFRHWNECRPLIRLSLAEHPKICFYFLIDSFCFPIHVKDARLLQTYSFLPASWVGDTHEETDFLPIGDREEKEE